MTVTVTKNESSQREGSEAGTFLVLTFSILGVAVAYFGALYLIVR